MEHHNGGGCPLAYERKRCLPLERRYAYEY